MKTIAIFLDYFGSAPQWMDMFLESCRHNTTISWFIHTDIKPPTTTPENVHYIPISFKHYCERASDILNIKFKPNSPYNICNLRPMFGALHKDIIREYDYYGWGDIDVIYGDIRSIYTDDIFNYNVISSDDHTCSGHLTLIKNECWLANAYRYLSGWQARLEDPGPFTWDECLDEARLSALFCPIEAVRNAYSTRFSTYPPRSAFYDNNYFKEQWTTPFTPGPWLDKHVKHPEVWYWDNGVLTNEQDADRHFLYLHLMNFKGKRWVSETLYGQALTWDLLPSCMHFHIDDLRSSGVVHRRVRIDRLGLHLF